MKYTILPIQTQHVRKILKGEKLFEFRNSIPDFSREDISNTIIIYSSKEDKAIIGEFDIEEILEGSFNYICEKTGATPEYKKRLRRYYTTKEVYKAIKIGEIRLYKKALQLNEIKKINPNFVAPQCYRFLDENDNILKNLKD